MSFLTYARASVPMAGEASAFNPPQVRARTSISGESDSGTRPPSGRTSAIGTLRPA